MSGPTDREGGFDNAGWVCDVCGDALLADSDVRYVLDIRGYAAYDPMEITAADLERDLESEMATTLAELSERDAQSLEDDVHKEFRRHLCPRCWKLYRDDPLRGLREVVAKIQKEKSQGN